MSPNCKAKALYVKTSVIQCGVADYHGDILGATAIKNIFTSFNNQNRFDLHHNRLPVDDVSLLENYISKSDEEIAGTIVPTGSWNVVLRVDNPSVQQKILDGEIQGVSLTTRIRDSCSAGLTNSLVTYSEVPNADCWQPVYISLVDDPANLVGLHVMDYSVYIEKSKRNVHKFGGKTLSFLDKVKKLIAEEEASPSEPVIEKSTGADGDVEVEASVDEKKEEEPVVIEKATTEEEEVEVVEETTTTEEEEEVIEKATTDEETVEADVEAETEETEAEADTIDARIKALEDKVAELEALVNKVEPTTESEPVNATTEDKKDDEPVITKSAKIEVTNTEGNTTTNFYEMSGRDPVTGKKIRNKTKILN